MTCLFLTQYCKPDNFLICTLHFICKAKLNLICSTGPTSYGQMDIGLVTSPGPNLWWAAPWKEAWTKISNPQFIWEGDCILQLHLAREGSYHPGLMKSELKSVAWWSWRSPVRKLKNRKKCSVWFLLLYILSRGGVLRYS